MDMAAGYAVGCKHYKRSVKLIAPCCSKVYYCRFCHDENENHTLKRSEVVDVQCARCNTRQRAKSRCSACKVVFGKYTCLICNLFDHEDKKQFHCSDCGICRIGGKNNYFHCKTCNLCLNVNLVYSHKCVENVSRAECSICLQNLHDSVKPLKLLQCGHLLHEECYNSILNNDCNRCPLCRSPLCDKIDYPGKPY